MKVYTPEEWSALSTSVGERLGVDVPDHHKWSFGHHKTIVPDPRTPGRNVESVQFGEFVAETPDEAKRLMDELKPEFTHVDWEDDHTRYGEGYEKKDPDSGQWIGIIRLVCEWGKVKII